ncbi:helix-turn-helix domain-containing protein [Flavobacterium azooxidireducens]|uniref:Helix-turn-helix domain-containing protein n=1 Tax=Flavobacterium azooxidireducens TaxID=1871076 RepID=A0ABY4KH18_9FLAO|nr:helix-turn-helix transcriptional regulator [Flavobacterium azooxidireducens]UPQ79969.1 helix-turn-helix domain-containing protein [Flavobacterium azooxidireducens]
MSNKIIKLMNVGTKIRKLRIKNKMSQEELADNLQIAQTSVSNFEVGKTIPDFIVMQKICEVFNVGFDYFLDSDKEKFIFKKNENNNIIVGKIEVLNNSMPEGILENMIKRIEQLEKRLNLEN